MTNRMGTSSALLLCICIIWLAVIARYAFLVPQLPGRARDWNFDLYYTSGLISNSGLDPAVDDVAALGRRSGYHFPPPKYYSNSTPALMLVFKALARLPLMAAYWIWVGAGILAFAMAISLLIKITDLGSSSSALLVGNVLLYPPVIDHLWYAESEFVFLFLLVLAFWLLRAGKDVAGGALLALVALLKVYPAVMGGYLFATRRWKAFASAIVAGIAGVLITVAILGVRAWIELVVLDSKDTFTWNSNNLSLSGFVTRMYLKIFGAHANTTVRLALIGAGQLGVVACTYWITRRTRGQSANLRCYSLWVIAMLIVSPIVWLSYLPMLVIPIFELVSVFESTRKVSSALDAMILSVALLFALTPLFPFLMQSRAGRLVAEYQFVALVLAYLSMLPVSNLLMAASRFDDRRMEE
jgi:hypothetical protein